jgi:hypothetical protein
MILDGAAMSITNAAAGWLTIAAAAIWVGKGVGAVIAGRRSAAPPSRRDRAQKWQWLDLGALQVALGIWFLTGPTRHPVLSWWLDAGFGVIFVWMAITDFGPWLRSRLNRRSKHAPS